MLERYYILVADEHGNPDVAQSFHATSDDYALEFAREWATQNQIEVTQVIDSQRKIVDHPAGRSGGGN
jgi:hypothetical protein